MKFFKSTDFIHMQDGRSLIVPGYEWKVADIANAKLGSDGKTLFIFDNGQPSQSYSETEYGYHTHKGLLVNIQSIEKCDHPKEKVRRFETRFNVAPNDYVRGELDGLYQCKCGARVKPKVFEEC